MWRSVRIRWLSACAAAVLLAAGLSGCKPGQNPASDSSVVTDYPPVSTPATEPSGGATTTESAGPGETGTGGSRLVTVTRRVSDTSVVPGTPGTPDVYSPVYTLQKGDFCLIKKGDVKATIVVAEDAGPT